MVATPRRSASIFTPVDAIAVYHGAKNISGIKVTAALDQLGLRWAWITAADIAAGRLDRHRAVIFPGGHSIRIGVAGERRLRRWLAAGGGMLGICAGCQFGVRLKLLPVKHRVWRAQGLVDLRIVTRHPISAGYAVAGRHRNRATWKYENRGRVRMRYANGGLMVPTGTAAKIVVSYDEEGQFGAVVAGRCGRGRVVLIGPHPESTPPPDRHGVDAAASQDPLKLFANAVHFCANLRTASARRPAR